MKKSIRIIIGVLGILLGAFVSGCHPVFAPLGLVGLGIAVVSGAYLGGATLDWWSD